MNITKETIMQTRQWFLDNTQACIDEAISGDVKVNDINSYVESTLKRMDDIEAGEWDHTFTFQQRAVYIQTGECHALLP
jgi:hypothetical protein